MQQGVVMAKFEEVTKEIAGLKTITQNTYMEVMRIRDWKDSACSEQQPCYTTSKLSSHMEHHKESKSTIFFIIGPIIGVVSSLVVILVQYFIFK